MYQQRAMDSERGLKRTLWISRTGSLKCLEITNLKSFWELVDFPDLYDYYNHVINLVAHNKLVTSI